MLSLVGKAPTGVWRWVKQLVRPSALDTLRNKCLCKLPECSITDATAALGGITVNIPLHYIGH